jgi:signal transduction histidine kinase
LLHELGGHAQSAIVDVRRVIYQLRPPALDDLGLVAALREQTARVSSGDLQVSILAPERLPPLAAAIEVAAYRIVMEAFTNVLRHAQARTCHVMLALEGPGEQAALTVEVQDDGCGIAPGRQAGVGLQSMRERAVELGGTCVVEPVSSGGTRVHARLPLGAFRAQEA